jgi:hypothetical protein
MRCLRGIHVSLRTSLSGEADQVLEAGYLERYGEGKIILTSSQLFLFQEPDYSGIW